jgi:beta-glucosidase
VISEDTSPPARHAGAVGPDPAGFPADFVWGVATAAYQIEGAVAEDGREPSIWDTFARTPGRVRGGDTGDVADDHYHRSAEDLDLLDRLGVPAYRFSVSWPRVLAGGVPNQAGLDFYDRLVDGLLERGIEPWLTLYHWDLPQALEDRGGWPERDTALRFAEMAGVVAHRLGDRVSRWTTLNEPWCSAFLGYGSGRHAPGRTDPEDALAAAHHLLLGHGLAVDVLRAAVPDAQVGITLNLYPVTPLDDRPGNRDAARRVDGLQNRWFLDPVLRGRYPEDIQADLDAVSAMSWVRDGDLEVVSRPLDFLGVNYYTRHVVSSGAYPGVGEAEFHVPHETVAANGWGVDPDGLVEVLQRVATYSSLPVYVTENGSAWEDRPSPDGSVDDPGRTAYLQAHVDACRRAIESGVPLAGYFAWSLLDNFEWAEGYAVRFGIVHVDYATQRRTVKTSGRWYGEFVRAHRSAILTP